MKRTGIAVVGLVTAMVTGVMSLALAQGPPSPAITKGPDRAQISKMVDSLPLSFVPNAGQSHPDVSYYVAGANNSLYFSPAGMTYSLSTPAKADPSESDAPEAQLPRAQPQIPSAPTGPGQRWAVKVDYLGANPVVPQAAYPRQTKISYFKGNAEQHKTGLSTYGQIAYKDLWPGIDLVYSGHANKLKYDFVVHPGADPSAIRLGYRGGHRNGHRPRRLLDGEHPGRKLQRRSPGFLPRHRWPASSGLVLLRIDQRHRGQYLDHYRARGRLRPIRHLDHRPGHGHLRRLYRRQRQ
ncbi:MAG: hypothetical protein ACRDRT_03010 [Pseudonocardiaceae bacterium]